MGEANIEKIMGDYPVQIPRETWVKNYSEMNKFQDQSPRMSDIFEIILRRKKVVILCALTAVLVVFAACKLSQPVFKAESVIDINIISPRVTKFEEMNRNPSKDERQIDTQTELLKSDTLARRVIERLELNKNPDFNPALPNPNAKTTPFTTTKKAVSDFLRLAMNKVDTILSFSWLTGEEKAKSEELAKLSEQQAMERLFARSLEVEQKPNTSIVTISFESTNPEIARNVVNTLIEEFSGWDMDRRIDAARNAKEQLGKQIGVARTEMDKAERQAVQFSKEKGIVSLDTKLNEVFQQLEKINEALAKTEAERIQKAQVYQQAKSSNPGESTFVVQNNLIQTLRQQYIELMGEYEKLRIFYKPDYPNVKNIRAKMVEMGQKIEAEQQRILNAYKNDYLAALNTEKALKQTAEEKKASAIQLNEYGIQYKNLEREVEINKQIFQSLLERSKEIDANVGTELGNIKVVDLASLPLTPSRPRTTVNVLLALLLGTFGGVVLALAKEFMDPAIRRVDEVSQFHDIPVLGVVPLATNGNSKDLHALVQVKPSSLFSEVIRCAKACLLLTNGNGKRTMMVTSTAVGEGKTTISANLALAFATTGKKVLIIDADLRRRSGLSSLLAIHPEKSGLSDYLAGASKLTEIVQNTGFPGLHIIPTGQIRTSPAELLSSDRMSELLAHCSGHFDTIFIDAPPFGVFADVLCLANRVDGVILVTEIGKAQRQDVRFFTEQIRKSNANLVGAIINKLDLSRYNAGYHYKQYRQYQYDDHGHHEQRV